jgi:hypothetical protein
MLVIFNFQLGQDFFEPIYRGVLLHLTQTVLYVKSHFPPNFVGFRDAHVEPESYSCPPLY